MILHITIQILSPVFSLIKLDALKVIPSRSIHKFKGDKIPDTYEKKYLEAAMAARAPACNPQHGAIMIF